MTPADPPGEESGQAVGGPDISSRYAGGKCLACRRQVDRPSLAQGQSERSVEMR